MLSVDVLDELIRRALTCTVCGKAHEERPADPKNKVVNAPVTWADSDDGHAYRMASQNWRVVPWLRKELTIAAMHERPEKDTRG